MIVVTAGHVDHGKTTLLRALTGRDTDRLAEEKRRGMSIDLGFTYHHFTSTLPDLTEPQQHTLSFVDVPGHTDFTNNMLTGAWSADVALLVVSAVEGVMPQTREHLLILTLLAVRNIVVVMTFADLVTPAENALRQAEVLDLLKSVKRQESAFFSVSATTGYGIDTLLEHLEDLAGEPTPAQEDRDGHLRFAIDRAFTLKGIGTVVTGTVRAGTIQTGDSLLHSGSGELVRAKSLRLDDRLVDSAGAGQRLAIAINMTHSLCHRGDWLIDQSIHQPTFHFDAKIEFAESFKAISSLGNKPKASTPVHMSLGAAHHLVTLRPLTNGALANDTGSVWYQIRSREPMFAHCGDRLILRDASAQHTFAGGQVIDIHSPRRNPDTPERIATLQALALENEEALKQLLDVSDTGIALDRFALNRNLRPPQVQTLVARLIEGSQEFESLHYRSSALKKSGLPTLLASKHFNRYAGHIKETLADTHCNSPTTLGLSEGNVAESIAFTGLTLVFNALTRTLIERNEIMRTGTLLHLPAHMVAIEQLDNAFIDQLRPILTEAGFVAPRVYELMEMLKMEQQPLELLLQNHCRAGNLVQISRNRYYLPETVSALASSIEKLANDHSETGISVIQYRDSSGIGRNLCIEILEYFDALGLTRRSNNVRFLQMPYEDIFTT